MAYADYDFYVKQYHGNMNEADFLKFSESASDFIDSVTFGRITKLAVIPEKIKRACCACAEAMHCTAGGSGTGIAQESVGEHSVSYVQLTQQEYSKALYSIVKTYLGNECCGGIKLMYRGV